MNIPLMLTYIRIVLIPAIVVVFYLPVGFAHFAAAIIFILAAITDWLDGYLARSLNQTTKLGEFLDPVADKLVVATALVIIVGEFHTAYLVIPAAIIIGREIIVSALREWMAEIGKRTSVAVSRIGKIKTVLQMVSIVLLLFYSPHRTILIIILGVLLLYIAAILTLWSMIMYLKAAWPDLTSSLRRQ
ncbi:MAG: CDP-diacylglycerol--glycerol-3-phosphate 3-phosphatidyltransferase [Coxiella sp. DG_40]|nr:MAG: CDP-diacylglycerol--glycerol-3-phosphate 3-phosphatidyltransferase [Coxiella sp. DG_40]